MYLELFICILQNCLINDQCYSTCQFQFTFGLKMSDVSNGAGWQILQTTGNARPTQELDGGCAGDGNLSHDR